MQTRFHAGEAPEFFVSSLDHIEMMGSVSRQVWVSERLVGGKVIYVPAVHIITPNTVTPEVIRKLLKTLGADVVAALHIESRMH